jgi:hypothetical protein
VTFRGVGFGQRLGEGDTVQGLLVDPVNQRRGWYANLFPQLLSGHQTLVGLRFSKRLLARLPLPRHLIRVKAGCVEHCRGLVE